MSKKQFLILLATITIISFSKTYAAEGDPCDTPGICGSPECSTGEVCAYENSNGTGNLVCQAANCAENYPVCSPGQVCCGEGAACSNGLCLFGNYPDCETGPPLVGWCEDQCDDSLDCNDPELSCGIVATPTCADDTEHWKCLPNDANSCGNECELGGDDCGFGWECQLVDPTQYPWNCSVANPPPALKCVQSEANCDDQCGPADPCTGGTVCIETYPAYCPDVVMGCGPAYCIDECDPANGNSDCDEGLGETCQQQTPLASCGNAILFECQPGSNTSPPTFTLFAPYSKHIDIWDLLVTIGKILFPVGMAIGLFFIAKAGWTIGLSEGDPGKVKQGQEELTAAIIGIVFLLLSAGILRVIISTLLGS